MKAMRVRLLTSSPSLLETEAGMVELIGHGSRSDDVGGMKDVRCKMVDVDV